MTADAHGSTEKTAAHSEKKGGGGMPPALKNFAILAGSLAAVAYGGVLVLAFLGCQIFDNCGKWEKMMGFWTGGGNSGIYRPNQQITLVPPQLGGQQGINGCAVPLTGLDQNGRWYGVNGIKYRMNASPRSSNDLLCGNGKTAFWKTQ